MTKKNKKKFRKPKKHLFITLIFIPYRIDRTAVHRFKEMEVRVGETERQAACSRH
jgi:hypothetical protein